MPVSNCNGAEPAPVSISHQHYCQGQQYCAVFALKTPVDDDSGIAHAIEHLVFRRSAVFDDASSLFQLSSLLPLTINATTTDGYTYFHCQALSQEICLLGIEYLLAGLTKLKFTHRDVEQEVAGVIGCELKAQQRFIACAGTEIELTRLLVTDHCPQRQYLYGGTSDTISQLTVAQLQQYYQQHYHRENIRLYTSCVGDGRSFTAAISSLLKTYNSPLNVRRQPLIPLAPLSKSDKILVDRLPSAELCECCWWLIASTVRIEWLRQQLADTLDGASQWLVTEPLEQNRCGQRPLRIISVATLSDSLIAVVEQLLAREQLLDHSDPLPLAEPVAGSKLPADCGLLIAAHHHGTQFHNTKRLNTEHQHSGDIPETVFNQRILAFTTSPNAIAITAQEPIVAQQSSLLPLLLPFLRDLITYPTDTKTAAQISVELDCRVDGKLLLAGLMPYFPQLGAELAGLGLSISLNGHHWPEVSDQLLHQAGKIIGQSSQLPQLLVPLSGINLIDNCPAQANFAMVLDSTNELFYKVTLKHQFKVAPFHQQCNQQHFLLEYSIGKGDYFSAWCLAYILGAYPAFLALRTQGNCYTIASRFCPYQARLLIFAAFCHQPRLGGNFTINALNQLMADQKFIAQALPLAQAKILSQFDPVQPNVSHQVALVNGANINELIMQLRHQIALTTE